jgi:hypothetical protein
MSTCPNAKGAYCECQPQDGLMCPHGPQPPYATYPEDAALARKDALLRKALEALSELRDAALIAGQMTKRESAIAAIQAELSQSPAPAAPAPLRMLTKDECHELAETVGLGSASVQRMFCEVNNLGEPK